mgnify:CR=1 FL=1
MPDPAEDHLLPLVEVNVQSLYVGAVDACRNALLVGRRDINRLVQLNLKLGDDCRADSEEYIARLERIMDILDEVR